MKVTQTIIYKLDVAYAHPTVTPIGTISCAQNVVIKVECDNGLSGWGEASPFAPITGNSQESSYVTAQQLAQGIKGKNPLAIDARMAEINAITVGQSSIRSAFDMALYDIAAQAASQPLYQFLGGEQRPIRTGLTIGIQTSVEKTVTQAAAILEQGFDAIKMKVGRPGLEDVAHVAAVREVAGSDVAIKIDSNQGWDFPTAVANIKAMAPLNLQYSEQPLMAWDYDNLARLRDNVDLPICADESMFDDKDALKLIRAGAADYLNIKLGKSGGIHTGLKINAIAEAAGVRCMIGCFAESRLGLSAAAHFAMARPNITFIDLDSALKFKSDPVMGGLKYDPDIGGLIHLTDTAGLGATIDERQLNQDSRVTV